MAVRSDKYQDEIKRLRAEGLKEQAAEHFAMTKYAEGKPYASSKTGYTTETMGDVWKGSPIELKQGTGGYVYEHDPMADTYTIVKTKGGKAGGGQVISKDSNPSAFEAIKNDVARVSQMALEGSWDVEKNTPKAGASPVYAGKPAAAKKPVPAVLKGAGAAAAAPVSMFEPGESSTVEEEPEYGVSEDVGTSAPSSVFKAFVDELTARNPDLGTAIREFAWDKPAKDIVGETLLALTRSHMPKDGKYANVDAKSSFGVYSRK